VTASVTNAVRDPKTYAVLFRAGATASGRISRMEHWRAPAPRLVIGIHWNSIAMGEDAAPLAAIPDHSGEMAATGRPMPSLQRRPMPAGPADALLFSTSARRYVVRGGYEMRWVTVMRGGNS
jgi:hypothetical protein